MRRHRHHGWRWPLAATLALVMAGTGGATGASAQDPPAPEPVPVAPVPAAGAAHAVTLITGDRVLLEQLADGRHEVTVDAAERPGVEATFRTVDNGEQVYVFPSDAVGLIPDVLDRELFNVTRLAGYGYTRGVPVIMTGTSTPARHMSRTAAAPAGITTTADLSSIGATAATIAEGGQWWRGVRQAAGAPAGAHTSTGGGPLAGVGRIWLDAQVEVALSESAPMIGAPEAWDLGLDGAGVTVAVLDTGVDADHPDLTGKVVAERNFSSSVTADDRHGHGTHVAGIVAGTGAASGGEHTGVAPGADLVNAKVLGDDGRGPLSDIIAGMEWAVGQGVDVVNMSLGGPPTDGNDPMSLAVNELTDQHDVLFAIAAGNSGPRDQTVGSPGSADAALTVGSVDKAGQLAGNSSRGPRAGDFAIKPDVTAPGVGIASARADGTALGPPVGEHYTRISGTSMATPHVAGAAAILLQDDPDLNPAQLKARLVGTAVPDPGLDVYQQGGGRIDIPAALEAPVQATPAPLDLGYLPFPHGDVDPVTAEVTYTNLRDDPVTLDLALQVRSRQGAVPGPQMLSVDPAVVTIDPGGEAKATVTLDVSQGELGLYGGHLVATQDGQVAVRTPVGFHKEPERYDLTVIGIARDGRLAGGLSNLAILDVEDMTRLFRPGNGFVDGTITMRVPPGTYSVLGAIHTYDARDELIQETTFAGDPEVTVTEDVTLVLDAREANRISVTAPDPGAAPQGTVGFGYWRTAAAPGPIFGTAFLGFHASREYYALPMDPVTLGGFEFHTRWRLAEPEALLEVTDPVALTLDPVLMRAPAVDGPQVVELVNVGDGAAGDYLDVDVAGAVAMARRGPVPFAEQEQQAAAAGAVALIVTNDVPGRLTVRPGEPGTIPTLSLTMEEGDTLRGLLAEGEVTVRLDGTVWSPYVYDLVLLELGHIPADLHRVVDRGDLAALEVSYHNGVDGHLMGEARHFSRPFHASSAFIHPAIDGPRERTEYVLGGDEMAYRQTVFGEQPFEARLRQQQYSFYEPGERVKQSWFRQVVRPALLPGVGLTTRTGDTLDLEIYEWVDDAGNHFPELFGLGPYPGDTIRARLFRDGELVAEADEPRGSFPMAAPPARYRVELDVSRQADWWQRSTRTRTSWTFSSQRPAAGTEVLPLLSIDYDLELDLRNTAPHPRERRGPATVALRVEHQTGGGPAVAGARLWVSYDDGDTWRPRPVRRFGDGRFEAILDSRDPAGGSGFASVRVEAWDADGNRVDQEVIRAWRLAER